jgi:FtsZ-interacting cell division protein ZipA
MAVGVCVVMLLCAVAWVRAAEEASDKPKKQPAARLTQPWSKIASLSDEQKTQIRAIHAKAVADKKAIEEKERQDILTLLNDEQKAEAQKLMDEQKKPRSAAADKEGDPTNEKKIEEKKSEPGA